MGLRGPTPRPSAITELAENPGHRPSNHHEPKPVQELYPEPPHWLSNKEKEVWIAIIPDLVPLGLITRIDKTSLARYCMFYSQLLTIKAQVDEMTTYTMPIWAEQPKIHPETGCYIVEPKTREIVKNRYVKKLETVPQFHQIIALSQEMRKCESEFGLTPAARTRISIKLEEEVKDGGTSRPRKKFTYRDRRD